MATPASLFRSRATEPVPHPAADTARPDEPTGSSADNRIERRQWTAAHRNGGTRAAPSGVVAVAGLQQFWVGKNYAGLTVTLWIHLSSIHIVLADDVIKTVPSRVTTADLEPLSQRGVRIGRPDPASRAPTAVGPLEDRDRSR